VSAGNSRDDLVAQLDAVWASLADLGTGVSDEQWRRPTPCPGWDVAAQYAHVVGTESMLLGRPQPPAPEPDPAGGPAHVKNRIGSFNEAWVDHLRDRSRAEVLELFDQVTGERRRALAAMSEEDFSAPSWTPVGEADYRRFMQIRVFDCWVHEQDVRSALGRPGHEAGPVVDQSLDEIVRALGYVVGKRAGAPAGSRLRFELTGAAARRIDVEVGEKARVVEALDGPATTTITLPALSFAALACGRAEPAGVPGPLSVAGDEELGRRVLVHLAFTI
jgi:uncharacterized protein (TIGR03083 family)